MEEQNNFARDFFMAATGLRIRDRIAGLRLAPEEDPQEQAEIVQAQTDNVSDFFDRVKKELLKKDVSDDVLRVIGGDPYGFCLVLKELKDVERGPLIWTLFDLSTSEVDSIRDPEDGVRKRWLGILKGIMFFCHVVPPEPEEMVMGGEKISFYNWDAVRLQVRESRRV